MKKKGVRAMQAAQLTAIRAQLEEIFGTKIEVSGDDASPTFTITGSEHSLPLTISAGQWNEIKVLPGKTPRYYPEDDLHGLFRNLEAYANGKTCLLDYVDENGVESKQDRLILATQVDNMKATDLQEFCVNLNLIGSKELDHMLLMGGKVRLRFWKPELNFNLVYNVDKLVRQDVAHPATNPIDNKTLFETYKLPD
jgi:hypothetical protein